MNEQLVVKNFGPIKDATVDFKRVTVFIGPTGGGKSTLAKLAAVFRDVTNYTIGRRGFNNSLFNFAIEHFASDVSSLTWHAKLMSARLFNGRWEVRGEEGETAMTIKLINAKISANLAELNELKSLFENASISGEYASKRADELYKVNHEADTFYAVNIAPSKPHYFPAERILISALGISWPDLIKEKVALPTTLLEFAKSFLGAKDQVKQLVLKFLDTEYINKAGDDLIALSQDRHIKLSASASGIQSVTPLLVLLEHLSRNTEQAQSFIIEEPELNLFPTAQFELIKILVNKCARMDGKNDLVLTTHSPYVLTALNLMCYAFRLAQQDEATAEKVAKLIPRHCWIDPDQFAAYYVDRPDTKRKQQVRSIINKKTGLIEENELDTASEALGDIFDKLVRLHKPTSATARAK